MKSLILKVVLGNKCVRKVGTVEGLLLMGEWTLHNQDQVDDGNDASAWSIVGLAVRLAYLLRLEDSGFKSDDTELDSIHRERLVWTCKSTFLLVKWTRSESNSHLPCQSRICQTVRYRSEWDKRSGAEVPLSQHALLLETFQPYSLHALTMRILLRSFKHKLN
jgi:hypothetical protein